MSIWLDKKYIGLNSNSLRNFRWKSPNLANCSCPLCGDSSSNKLKARGYFHEKNGKYFYFCHNCGASTTFRNFLKDFNSNLYQEYTRELFLEINTKEHIEKNPEMVPEIKIKTPKFLSMDTVLRDIKKISQLKPNHPARKYIEWRKIPTNLHYRLYYAPKFKAWINTILPEKFSGENDEPRLVIPFFDKKKHVFCIQGRAFGDTEPKYFNIPLDESFPMVYGLDNVNFSNKYYILEGPIDSLFIKNSIAMGGADLKHSPDALLNLEKNGIFVYDNEPRNKDIIKKIENVLTRNMQAVIWPDNISQKDINEMIQDNISPEIIKLILDENIYSGLEGICKLKMWSKISQ